MRRFGDRREKTVQQKAVGSKQFDEIKPSRSALAAANGLASPARSIASSIFIIINMLDASGHPQYPRSKTR